MTVYEPRSSGVESDRSSSFATTNHKATLKFIYYIDSRKRQLNN